MMKTEESSISKYFKSVSLIAVILVGLVSIIASGGGGDGTSSSGGSQVVPKSWGAAGLIETSNGNASSPQVAVGQNGNAIAVWSQDDGVRESIHANHYDALSDSWGVAGLIETDNTGNATSPQVAIDSNGNAIAVWYQDDGVRLNIYANRYDALSRSWGLAESIETDNAGDAWVPQVAVDPNGNAIAVWYQNNGVRYNIYANRYDEVSNSWGPAALIETDNTGSASAPQVAIDSIGNAIAVWMQDDGVRLNIHANRYDVLSDSWGSAELIETDNVGDASFPQVAVNQNGNAVAVWVQDDGLRYSIYANRYDALSRSWGAAELIEADNAEHAFKPDIAVPPNGNAVAVWFQYDGVRYNIHANSYDELSRSWGLAESIETDNSGDAWNHEVVADRNGNAIAVWTQHDGVRYNIYANCYDALSGSWGSAKLIDADNIGDAWEPHVAADPNGNAIVVWMQDDGVRDNIWANIYN
jgi:hypothetical protein